MMMLVSQVENLTSLMKFAWRSLSTSSLMVLRRSSPIFLFIYDIGLAWGQIASLWQIMPGWIPACQITARQRDQHFYVAHWQGTGARD